MNHQKNRALFSFIVIARPLLLLLLLLPTLCFAQQNQKIQQLEQDIDGIKDNLNQNPDLFNRFTTTKYRLSASISLIDQSRLDKDHLINPKGGSLDLNKLNNLPGLTHITMLATGGFQFTHKPPTNKGAEASTIRIEGISLIEATPTGLLVDNMHIAPYHSFSLTKTKNNIHTKGFGTLTINKQVFDIQSPDKPMIFVSDNSGIRSITIPAHSTFLSSLKYQGHEFKPQEGDITLYLQKQEYSNARGNKAWIGNKLSISQETGRLILDRYYHFQNGEVGLIRRQFLREIPPTPVSYTYKNKPETIIGPVPIENTKGYTSIADLFSSYGYGSGSENKAARRAYYQKYIGKGYSGSAKQNIQLLTHIQNGKIPFFSQGEKRFEFSSQPEPVYLRIQGESRTPTYQLIRQTVVVLPVNLLLKNTPVIRKTTPSYNPDYSPLGKLHTIPEPPQGIDPVQGKVTYYYTPVYDPSGTHGLSEKDQKTFKQKVIREGSGISRGKDDRWYHLNYKLRSSLLTERNKNGITASGQTPFIGMIAAPKEIPLGYIAYVQTNDGTYARFLVGDRGGKIKISNGVYHIDIWTGLGKPSIVHAEKTNTLAGLGIPKNPKIYFVRSEEGVGI